MPRWQGIDFLHERGMRRLGLNFTPATRQFVRLRIKRPDVRIRSKGIHRLNMLGHINAPNTRPRTQLCVDLEL